MSAAKVMLAQRGFDLRAFATQAGLLMLRALIDAEAEQLTGSRYAHQTEIDRWGTRSGYVRIGGQNLALKRPRLRNQKTGARGTARDLPRLPTAGASR